MPSKQLVEKRNELDAKRKTLKAVFAEAKTESGDNDWEKVKTLGDGLSIAAKGEKIKAMKAEVVALSDEVENLASLEQIESEEIQAERKAGSNGGMRHPNIDDLKDDEGKQTKGIGQLFVEHKDYKDTLAADMARLRSKDGQLRIPFKQLFSDRNDIRAFRKAITTVGLGSGTSGVQMPQRLEGITELARRELRIRDLMRVRTMTTGNSFDFVKQLARTNNASMQHEGARKAESTYTWTIASDTVKTIAHFTKVSRQALDDVSWLRGVIEDELLYGLLLKEESEILAGDGLGQHLNGLLTQATAYDAGYNVANDTKIDKVRHAKLQARLAGLGTFAPDGIVLNPEDLHDIELIKTEEGGANKGLYIVGDPRSGTRITFLWGLPVVESDAMSSGQFLVGAFGTAAELIDRMQAMVAIAYENEADFVENLATILAEERLGMAVRRPDAFIKGTF